MKSDSIDSAVLGQKRAVDVYLPQESAKEPAQRYETIYVLDGDWNAQIVINMVTFMRQVGRMPPVMVVSVPNFIDEHGGNSRDNNFLPAVVDGKPKPGSAPDFLAFLKTELVPYIDRHYPANGTRLLHGHSFGGTFAVYALMYEPALFDGYLILDPALWWGDHALDKVVEAELPGVPAKGKAIYIAARAGRAFEYMGISTLEPILKSKAPSDLHWNLTAYVDETHDSLKLKGTYDALKYAYEGYTPDPIELAPSSGIVLKGKPVYLAVYGDPPELRYATDGSMPNASSPKFDDLVAVTEPEKTTIRLISNRGVFDRVVPHNLKTGKALSPTRRASDTQDDAWRYAYYSADAWSGLSRAKPLRRGETQQDLDLAEFGRDAFAGVVERSFDILEEGYYVFGIASSDKARLWVAGTKLIDENSPIRHNQQAVIVPLRKGVYSIRLEFQRAAKTSRIEFAIFRCRDNAPKWWDYKLFSLKGETKNENR